MNMIVILVVICALDSVTKGLVKGLEDLEIGERVETVQITASLRSDGILRRVPDTWGKLLWFKLKEKTIS